MARKSLESMSGVYRRKNGSYEKRFSVDGKRYSVYGYTAKELQEKERAKREQLARGTCAVNERMTLDAYFDRWYKMRLQEIEKGNLRETTLYGNRCAYNVHIRPYIGHMRVVKISKRNIGDMLSEIATPSEYNLVLSTIRKILNDAIADEIISVNPAMKISKHNKTKNDSLSTHRAMERDEQRLFVQYAKGEYYEEMLLFLLATGARSGEAGALQWRDIDFKNRTIHIQRTRTKLLNGKFTTGETKTEKGNRVIPMSDAVESILRRQKVKSVEMFGEVLKIDNRVFNTPTNGSVYNNAVNFAIDNVYEKIKRETGRVFPRITAHALRDTYATRCIESGMNPKTLQTYLGHSTLSMTMDKYVSVTADTMQREMVDVFAL